MWVVGDSGRRVPSLGLLHQTEVQALNPGTEGLANRTCHGDLRVGLHSSQVHRDGTSRDGEFLQKGSEIHRTEKG